MTVLFLFENLTMALQAKGYHAISLTGWQAGITTESVHSSARITDIHTDRIQSYLAVPLLM